MKQSFPRSPRPLNVDRLVLILFSPVFACALFSMALMGLHATAWAVENAAASSVHRIAREEAPDADEEASHESMSVESELVEATADEHDIGLSVAEEVILDDLMGATPAEHEEMASEASAILGQALQALASELTDRQSSFLLDVQSFEREFCTESLEASGEEAVRVTADEIEGDWAAAFSLLQSARREMLRARGLGALDALSHASSLNELVERQEMIEHLVRVESSRMERLAKERKLALASAMLDAADGMRDRLMLERRVGEMNDRATAVDELCSQMRQIIKETQETISHDQKPRLSANALDALNSNLQEAVQLVVECECMVGDWYDRLDELGNAEGALSFGTGLDFLLPEAVFTDKWGRAIEEFFADRAKTSGPFPLQGFGRAMAASAFRHRVDPRLCAAVCIVESGGGLRCIRPFNAWGWGAADSDPHSLAFEWDSFEEAIESWHAGIVASSSGLADAASISVLGSVYCSSPQWGGSVVQIMQEMSAHALS